MGVRSAAEKKAKVLEKGLWRRAAAVYSDMFGIACSEEGLIVSTAKNVCARRESIMDAKTKNA